MPAWPTFSVVHQDEWAGGRLAELEVNQWAFAVNDGTHGVLVFSGTAGNEQEAELKITAMDPLKVPQFGEQNWATLYGPVQDIWHVYQWGYHWISFSHETDPNNPNNNKRKLGVLRVEHTQTGGSSSFVVLDIIWIVNDSFAQEGFPTPIDRTEGFFNDIDRPNDHFLVAWGANADWSSSPVQVNTANGLGGLAVGVRKAGPDTEIQFVHINKDGSYGGHSWVGSRNGPAGALSSGGTGCSAAPGRDILVHPPMTTGDVVHIFTSENLDLPGNNASAIKHIEVTTGLQATRVPSFPGLIRVDKLISDPNNQWHYSMPCAVRLGRTNEYWLITYRAVDLAWNREDGAIERELFSWPSLASKGTPEQVSQSAVASRPHAMVWQDRYLITCFYEDGGAGHRHNWLLAEEITLPTAWYRQRVGSL